MRIASIAAGLVLVAAFAAAQQAPVEGPVLTPRKSFDVVAVKVDKAAARAPMQWQPGGHFTMRLPIQSLISIGYQVSMVRVVGVPDWVRTTFFDINARAGGDVAVEERPAYYRGLLADRFKLAAHVEAREVPVYALTLSRTDGRLGPGLRPSRVDCGPIMADRKARAEAGERLPGAPVAGERPVCALVGGPANMTGGAVQISAIAGFLAGGLDRPVIDRTGLTGAFDVDFRSAPARLADAARAASDLPSVFTAVQEQLGLKLEETKAAIPVLVIDHIELPAED